jgi:hypothetical protein
MPKIYTPIPNAKPGVDFAQAVGYRKYFLGVDIGTTNDPTAFTLIEKYVEPEAFWGKGFKQGLKDPVYTVLQAFRLRLNLEYTKIVDTIEHVYNADELEGDVTMAVDATGVGAPVASMLRKKELDFHSVIITSGDAAREVEPFNHRVSKSYLVSQFNGAIEGGQLTFADGIHDAEQLKREFEDFQMTYTAAGNIKFEHTSTGHDDLILSSCLAYYIATVGPEFQSAVLPITFQGG